MHGIPGALGLLLALVVGLEYALKHWYENLLAGQHSLSLTRYARYRFVYALLLFVLLSVSLEASPQTAWLTLLVTGSAIIELPLAYIQAATFSRWGIRLRWVQLLPMVLLFFITLAAGSSTAFQPRAWLLAAVNALPWLSGSNFSTVSAILAAYVLVAQPANYLIRILLDKETDRLLPELFAGRRPIPFSHAAPPHGAESPPEVASQWAPHAGGSRSEATPANGSDWQTLRAGRVIGVLERWLIVTLVLISQYALLGLVLTAKSIARFRQLEEARFAEYYLLGTLYSLLIALLVGLGLRAGLSM